MKRRAALLLPLLSAAAAVVHESVWTRLLSGSIGSSGWALVATLASFMAGTGAGALLVRHGGRRLGARGGYVAAELAAGALGGGAIAVLSAATTTAIPIALVVALPLLASVAIGATFPLLVASLVRKSKDAPIIRAVYACGLFGAGAGCLAAAVLLVPRMGYDGAGYAAAAMNGALAVAARLLLPADHAGSFERGEARIHREALALFATAGALGVGAQVLWNRTVVPYAGAALLSFAGVLAAYLVFQTLGFALHARVRLVRARVPPGAAAAFAAPVALAALGLLGPLGEIVPARDAEPVRWTLAALLVCAAVVGPPALLLGVAQAGALHTIEQRRGRWADAAALVSGWGTVLSALGAVVALLALSAVGPRAALLVLAVPALVLLVVRREHVTVLAAAALAALLVMVAPGPSSFLGTELDREPALFLEHNAQETLAVTVHGTAVEPGLRRLATGGQSYSGDSLFAQRYMRLLGHLPAMASERQESALVICVGTGTTLDALAAHPFDHIDGVDVSPALPEVLALFSHVHGGDLGADRRIALHVDDGLRFLRASRIRYDVITLEPPPPRAPGASTLYSAELYALARTRLRAGGAVAQWLPLHGLTRFEVASIVRTFLAAFPEAELHLAERNEAVLVSRPVDRAARIPDRSELARLALSGATAADDTRVAGPRELATLSRGGAVIRLADPIPEHAPFGRPPGDGPLSSWLTELADVSPAPAESFAGHMLAVAPAFTRILGGRPRAADRARVERVLRALHARQPDDPYVEHMLGFGSYLEGRLERVRDEVPPDDLALARRLHARQRDWAAR